MHAPTPPFVPRPRPRAADRLALVAVGAAVRASLLVSPRPAALLVRRVFARGGARTKEVLDRHAPGGVTAVTGVRYGPAPDAVLDVARPAAPGRLPLVVWVHGGGWVGGSRTELEGWAAVLARHGYVVATPDYSRAPEHHYPTPVAQVASAVAHLVAHAADHGVDPTRVALAGDSAGAQIAAQVAALVTTPGYAAALGVRAPLPATDLRCVALACGPYDAALARTASRPAGRRLVAALLWAYSGHRRLADHPLAATWSVTDHLSAAFPPALVTVGNADPLRPHSELLAERLAALRPGDDTVFWPADREPPLGHEYQFDLDDDAAQQHLTRLLTFLADHLADAVAPTDSPAPEA